MGLLPPVSKWPSPRLRATASSSWTGRPAMEVWAEHASFDGPPQQGSDNWSLGFQSERADDGEWTVMAAFSFEEETGAIVMPACVPQTGHMMLHHRSRDAIMGGAARMAQRIIKQLAGRTPAAVLGFECGARTSPFLGAEATQEENAMLRNRVGPTTPWLGMMAWGEVTPVGNTSSFCNYTYPLLALVDSKTR